MSYNIYSPGTAAIMQSLLGRRVPINPMSYDAERESDLSLGYGRNLLRGTGNPRGTMSGAVRDAGEKLIGAFLAGKSGKHYNELEDRANSQWAEIMKAEGGLQGMQNVASGYGAGLDPKVAQQIAMMKQYDALDAPNRDFQREQWEWQKQQADRNYSLQERQLQATLANAAASRAATNATKWLPLPGGNGFYDARNPTNILELPEHLRKSQKPDRDPAITQANAAQLKKDQEAMESALNVMGQIDTALNSLGRKVGEDGTTTYNVNVGKMFGPEKTARQIGQYFGVGDSDTLKNMEALESSLEYIRLNLSEFMKGAISEREQEIMKRAAGSADLSPEGLFEVLSTAKTIRQRQYEDLAGRREYYENNGTFSGYNPKRASPPQQQDAFAPPQGFKVIQ